MREKGIDLYLSAAKRIYKKHKNVLFHRISKMDFLGPEYHKGDEATYMIEVTYRKNDHIDSMPKEELRERISEGMVEIGFANDKKDVQFIDITDYQYAYVIYDLNHTKNMEFIRRFYEDKGITLNGRFGNFEYWNMDRILRESLNVVEKITNN